MYYRVLQRIYLIWVTPLSLPPLGLPSVASCQPALPETNPEASAPQSLSECFLIHPMRCICRINNTDPESLHSGTTLPQAPCSHAYSTHVDPPFWGGIFGLQERCSYPSCALCYHFLYVKPCTERTSFPLQSQTLRAARASWLCKPYAAPPSRQVYAPVLSLLYEDPCVPEGCQLLPVHTVTVQLLRPLHRLLHAASPGFPACCPHSPRWGVHHHSRTNRYIFFISPHIPISFIRNIASQGSRKKLRTLLSAQLLVIADLSSTVAHPVSSFHFCFLVPIPFQLFLPMVPMKVQKLLIRYEVLGVLFLSRADTHPSNSVLQLPCLLPAQ